MDGDSPIRGSIVWQDLTCPDADRLRDFYQEVVGWQPQPQSMGTYHDYSMATSAGQVVSGICHARGQNANLPPQWLIYIAVEDVQRSTESCLRLGGQIIDGPRPLGRQRFCVIRDPAGAVAALIGP